MAIVILSPQQELQTELALDADQVFLYNYKQNSPNRWIIYGYWPASLDIDFMNCIKYEGHDPNCFISYRYDDNLLTSHEHL